jgi:hypothetical protein
MDRQNSFKVFPTCPRNIGIVDQYSWPQKDTNKYRCYNGISHPIYDCKGWINYSLPLEMYPPVDAPHPQIAMVKKGHLQYRGDPEVYALRKYPGAPYRLPATEGFSYAQDLTEGFYTRGPYMQLTTDQVPGYPLPSPHGDTRSCTSCCGYE